MKTPLQAKLGKLPKRVTKDIWASLKAARQALKNGDVGKAKQFIEVARYKMAIVLNAPLRIAAYKGVIEFIRVDGGYIVTIDDGSQWNKCIIAKSVRDFERQAKAVTAWKR